jgi:intein/homing endonuclease
MSNTSIPVTFYTSCLGKECNYEKHKKYGGGKYIYPKFWSRHKITKNVLINSDIAYFLGWYIAEGYTYKNKHGGAGTINLYLNKDDDVNGLTNIINKCFECQVKIHDHTESENAIKLTFCNSALRDYLFKIGKSHDKYIPNEIKESSSDIKRAFLKGLFLGDGHEDKRGRGGFRQIDTVSRHLASDTFSLLEELGYYSRLHQVHYNNSFSPNNKFGGFRITWTETPKYIRKDIPRFKVDNMNEWANLLKVGDEEKPIEVK